MFLFGHTGLTLAAAATTDFVYSHLKPVPDKNTAVDVRHQHLSFFNMIDSRLLLFGSLLPDIIDKPLGVFLLGGVYRSGRIYSHTLLFLVLLTAVGLLLRWRYKKSWLLVITFGVLTHLVFDSMWRNPVTLFWPLLGFTFPPEQLEDWFNSLLYELLHLPQVYIPEILGVTVFAVLLLWLVKKKRVGSFMKTGRVEPT
ncbi:MAG: metal-dependent hydrolase [Dehalococcoidia bacterium]|nr:metal-dependent hydrolase [Dehalococcoidia bacterium]